MKCHQNIYSKIKDSAISAKDFVIPDFSETIIYLAEYKCISLPTLAIALIPAIIYENPYILTASIAPQIVTYTGLRAIRIKDHITGTQSNLTNRSLGL